MIHILNVLRDFNVISMLVRIIMAAVLGGVIGMERIFHGRAAGIRTHMLVCLGSAMTVLVGLYAVEALGFSQIDPTRIAAQVISGIGFLGAGMILVRGRFEVVGLTTAAGLWTTAAIGLALGVGYYEGAVLCTILVLFATTVLNKYEQNVIEEKNYRYSIYIELDNVNVINEMLDILKNAYNTSQIDITAPRSAIANNVGMEVSLKIPAGTNIHFVMAKINQLEHVVFTLESV